MSERHRLSPDPRFKDHVDSNPIAGNGAPSAHPYSILVRVNEAAKLLGISRRTFYGLLQTNPDFRVSRVSIPGLRVALFRRDLLERAVDRLSPLDLRRKDCPGGFGDAVPTRRAA